MSLTSFLKNKDVKERFAQDFPKPPFDLEGEMIAPPITKHYSLIGTAFDYLMRFYLKKLNPNAITKEWVAELVSDMIEDKKLLKTIEDIIVQSKQNYLDYLKDGKLNDEIIKSSLLLAQLDPIFRAGVVDENIDIIDKNDMEDLKNLFNLINSNIFKSRNICLLNPTFGKASELVGGADVDLVIDNMIIDIKTTKFLKLDRNHLNQIIGYYILFLIGGIDGAPSNLNIDTIGIYYSRHGLLYKLPIKTIIKESKIPIFMKWFKRRVEEEFLL